METLWAYQCDGHGYYIGKSPRQHSPLEPGTWLIPAGCVLVEPPSIPEGHRARWVSAAWTLEALPPPPAPPADPIPPTDPILAPADPTGPTGS